VILGTAVPAWIWTTEGSARGVQAAREGEKYEREYSHGDVQRQDKTRFLALVKFREQGSISYRYRQSLRWYYIQAISKRKTQKVKKKLSGLAREGPGDARVISRCLFYVSSHLRPRSRPDRKAYPEHTHLQ
jgi:hypothetical protein